MAPTQLEPPRICISDLMQSDSSISLISGRTPIFRLDTSPSVYPRWLKSGLLTIRVFVIIVCVIIQQFQPIIPLMAKRPSKSHNASRTEPSQLSRPSDPDSLSAYVPTIRAAEIMGVGRRHVVYLLTTGKVRGIKLGHDWLVYAPSLDEYLSRKSPRGRPRSNKIAPKKSK